MPAAVMEQSQPAVIVPRKRWTRAECGELEKSGVWQNQHLELICGELIDKMGKNRPHTIALKLIQRWLVSVFGWDYVDAETSVDVAAGDNPINEPEPDLIVLVRPSQEILKGNVQPSDIRLLVEVSDTTLGFDLRVKGPLYARAGIPEYWVADIAGRRIIVHRNPSEGKYGLVEAYSAEESVVPLASPDHAFPVREAFPE